MPRASSRSVEAARPIKNGGAWGTKEEADRRLSVCWPISAVPQSVRGRCPPLISSDPRAFPGCVASQGPLPAAVAATLPRKRGRGGASGPSQVIDESGCLLSHDAQAQPTSCPAREAKPSKPQAEMSHPSPACGGGTAPEPRASGARSREGALPSNPSHPTLPRNALRCRLAARPRPRQPMLMRMVFLCVKCSNIASRDASFPNPELFTPP